MENNLQKECIKVCGKCGTPNWIGAKMCHKCGNEIALGGFQELQLEKKFDLYLDIIAKNGLPPDLATKIRKQLEEKLNSLGAPEEG